jgi:hypothetical protein
MRGFGQQIADAKASLREAWRVKSLRPALFPEWHALQLEEKELLKRLKTVRAQKKNIEKRYGS